MTLRRELGFVGATLLGLGSIVGTGVFVSLAIAAGIAGPAVIIAIAIAAALAACNGLSSAQLAANHPVSGGSYEYGYRYLNPTLGFAAGWMFVGAKAASAATAARGFAGYLLDATDQPSGWLAPVAVGAVVVLTGVALAGIRVSHRVNAAVVTVTLASLAAFIAAGCSEASASRLAMSFRPGELFHAAALMFVAFTGYGRVATLGEEVIEPRRTIPRAIIATLVVSAIVYVAVAAVAVGAAGAEQLAAAAQEKAAPLEVVARGFPLQVHRLVAVGAMTAMLGVLLNLVLGLSRVVLAMGRRGDLPKAAANLGVAVTAVGGLVAALAATASVKTSWTFSAFAVLIYYAVTNLAALQLSPAERLYSKAWAWAGLLGCLALAFAIEPQMWAAGLVYLGSGVAWRRCRLALRRRLDA